MHDETYDESVELDAEAAEGIAAIVDNHTSDHAGEFVRIRIAAAVNGYKRGEEITVEKSNKLFAGLIEQGMAEVIG